MVWLLARSQTLKPFCFNSVISPSAVALNVGTALLFSVISDWISYYIHDLIQFMQHWLGSQEMFNVPFNSEWQFQSKHCLTVNSKQPGRDYYSNKKIKIWFKGDTISEVEFLLVPNCTQVTICVVLPVSHAFFTVKRSEQACLRECIHFSSGI